jgi:hypothetical protein
LVNTVDNIIERALHGPRSELHEVQRAIIEVCDDPATTDEDRVRLMQVGELVVMSLMAEGDSP